MSDQPMKAEYVDRIDRLTELAEAEREVQAASTKFEQAQWEVVKAAEHLQEWTNVWKYRRESVLSRFPDTLTPEQITFYGQGNRLSEANEVLRQFCASVEAKNKQLSALTPPLQHKGGETEVGGLLDQEQGSADESNSQASSTDDLTQAIPSPAARPSVVNEVPGSYQKLGFGVGCDCGNEVADEYGMRWCCGGGDGVVYTLTDAERIVLDSQATEQDRVDPQEPAAYSPVNNADEPVTKPEADFFAQAIIPVQSGIEFSVDGGPKQATGAAKLFGGLGIFGKKIDA